MPAPTPSASNSCQHVGNPIQDRALSGTVTYVALCPRMDLVAIVIDRITIAILRCNWQRLATFPVVLDAKQVITAIDWSPDAAYVCVCTSKPLLSVYSIDRCAATRGSGSNRGTRDTDPIATVNLSTIATCVSWRSTPKCSARAYRDRASDLDVSSNSNSGGDCCGMLFVGDVDGMLTILDVSLRFVIAKLRVFSQGTRIGRIHLTNDFQHCFVVGYGGSGCGVGTNASSCSSVCLRTVDISFLASYWAEVDHITRSAIAFTEVNEKLSSLLDTIRDVWITQALPILLSTVGKPLEKLINDFGEDTHVGSPWNALHDVFCGAKVKGAVLQYLGTELSENGAKEALRSFRACVYDLEERLVEILPLAERLLFRGAEFRGISRLSSRFLPVGIVVEHAETMYEAVDVLYRKITEFCYEVETSCTQAEALLAWLVVAAARAGGESVQVKDEFDVNDGTGRDQDMILKFFEKMTLENVDHIDPADMDIAKNVLINDILPAMEKFERAVKPIVDHPQEAISRSIKVEGGICLPFSLSSSTFQRKDPICSNTCNHMKNTDGNVIYTTFVSCEGDLVNVWCNLDRSEWNVKCYSIMDKNVRLCDGVMMNDSKLLVAGKIGKLENRESRNGEEDMVSPMLFSCEISRSKGLEEGSGILTTTDEMIVVDLPKCTTVKGEVSTYSVAGQMGESKELHICINRKLEKASLTIEPRRVLLFQIPLEKSDAL